jgi:hypothetical protein
MNAPAHLVAPRPAPRPVDVRLADLAERLEYADDGRCAECHREPPPVDSGEAPHAPGCEWLATMVAAGRRRAVFDDAG